MSSAVDALEKAYGSVRTVDADARRLVSRSMSAMWTRPGALGATKGQKRVDSNRMIAIPTGSLA
jgi:hypothetical protein